MSIEMPKQEENAERIFNKIDALRDESVTSHEKNTFVIDAVYHFNVDLEKEFSREKLWKVRSWHKLIGSTYEEKYPEVILNDEERTEIESKIQDFVRTTHATLAQM